MSDLRRSESGASLIGIVVALAVLCLLIIVGTRMYTGERQRLDEQSANVLEESGTRPQGKRSILQTARKRIEGQEKQIQSQRRMIDEAR